MKSLLAATCFLAFAAPAFAQDVPRGLGHPSPDEEHWFGDNCCNMTDCEIVTKGAIEPDAEGWSVYYRSARGFLVEGTIPYGSSKIYQTEDKLGRQAACAVQTTDGVVIRCIYILYGT